jgi:hypothetical protein
MLHPDTYEDVEHDPRALPQALLVVVLSSVATGIGTAHSAVAADLALGTLFALGGWIAWSALVCVIGTRLLPQPQTEADVGQLMRTTGFASAPGLLGIGGLAPAVGPSLVVAVSIWMAMAMLMAVRQALDFTSLWRALAVVAVGWAAYIGVLLAARTVLTP